MSQIMKLLEQVKADRTGSLETLLGLAKAREIVRVRASKMRGFPWSTARERHLDATRCVWETATTLKEEKVRQIKTDGVAAGFLSLAIRNRLFRQVRADLGLREEVVVDDAGRRRYVLTPKFAREPFELALARIDDRQDPALALIRRESVLEVERAVATAAMPSSARAVLSMRIAGVPNAEVCRRVGRSGPTCWRMLCDARAAVRERLHEIRAGVPK